MASKGMKGLFTWCKKHTEGYRDVNVTNMSSSWKDGLAFCALLHRFRPDLIDFDSLSKENVLYNNQLAFQIAEEELGIAALLDAEDMANMKVPDKLSVMTYLSQYYSCFRHCNPDENEPQSVAVVNPASPAKGVSDRRMTDESICCICGKRVHLVQRYFEAGKLYHRTCHRTNSLEKIRGKNYFVQRNDDNQEQVDGRDKSPSEKVGKISVEANAVVTDIKPSMNVEKHEKVEIVERQLELPNLVESLGTAKGRPVDISALTPSPVTEERNLPDAEPPSLMSELPKAKESPVKSERMTVPKPRTRTVLSSADSGGRVSPAPVAQPRSKVPQPSSMAVKDDEKEQAYDECLNPFGTDSGSESDETLSSTSSEDSNPFESAPKIQVTDAPQVTAQNTKDTGVEEKEGNPFEVDIVESEEGEGGNPFGEYDEEEEVAPPTKSDRSDRFNPFSRDFKEDVEEETKKKKRRAPVPPKAPVQPVARPDQKAKSTHKKAPPPPPSWKHSASSKMEELNKANEKDPRFKASHSPKPSRPSMPPLSPVNKVIAANKRNKKPMSTKTRSAPGYGHPLVKRKVEIKMSEAEIATELKLLDVKLTDFETKGVKLEEMLRFAMDSDTEWTSEEDELLQEWFELVKQKNILLREESDLVFQMQQQKLEQEHADIEFQMRKLLNKPESAKTAQDKVTEEELLKKLVEVVERRNIIVNSIEEERQKEVEEDKAYENLKKLQQNPSKKKKKNKVKKMFSKKEKSKKEKTAQEQQS